jgi:hypothetical protein
MQRSRLGGSGPQPYPRPSTCRPHRWNPGDSSG